MIPTIWRRYRGIAELLEKEVLIETENIVFRELYLKLALGIISKGGIIV